MNKTDIIIIANKFGKLPNAGMIDHNAIKISPSPFQKADHIIKFDLDTQN